MSAPAAHQERQRGRATSGRTPERAWLHYRDDFLRSSPSDRIAKIRAGANASVLVGAARRLGLTQERMFQVVGLTVSTAKRKIGKKELLDPMVTERLTRVAAAETLAEEVFGSIERANAWLQAENTALGGEPPIALLDTATGAQEVTRVLHAIAYGMAA